MHSWDTIKKENETSPELQASKTGIAKAVIQFSLNKKFDESSSSVNWKRTVLYKNKKKLKK